MYSFYLIVWTSHIDIVVCPFALYAVFPTSGWMLRLFGVPIRTRSILKVSCYSFGSGCNFGKRSPAQHKIGGWIFLGMSLSSEKGVSTQGRPPYTGSGAQTPFNYTFCEKYHPHSKYLSTPLPSTISKLIVTLLFTLWYIY